jgi:natural product biosynthesis luciferase-like monooxygenase protein
MSGHSVSSAPKVERLEVTWRLPSLSVMFFGAESIGDAVDRYSLVRNAAMAADQLGYQAVWLPERHFDNFGGLFPNPSVLAAHLAALTRSCELRAGSVVAPLHDVIRIAEEWSVVDNLSGGGRVGLSMGSGWNTNDFVLAPDRYATRADHALSAIRELRSMWSGQAVRRVNGSGRNVELTIHPRPLSPELPLWLTASGNPETFRAAGRLGTNVLTHLLGQTVDELAEKIALYRKARAEAGHDPVEGRVTLMLHTLAAEKDVEAWQAARDPLRRYLRSALELELRASAGGGTVSGGRRMAPTALSAAVIDELLEERSRYFYEELSLLGTVEKCRSVINRMAAAGVDEIACLIDFGASERDVLESLHRLAPDRRSDASVVNPMSPDHRERMM